jgi:epoxyqueuosine reductase
MARAKGFDLVGVSTPMPSPQAAKGFSAWVDADMQGKMGYMGRPDRVAKTLDPKVNLPEAKSILVVGKNYFSGDLPPGMLNDPSRGIFASYAWGPDYHDVMTPRLKALRFELAEMLGREVGARVYVDTGPLLERDAALRAGMGFVGRNTMLIHPRWGAWLFLGEILMDVELEPDAPDPSGTCGQCTRCLDDCPTDAFPEPYVLDARRCISYLTIELKGPIPRDLRPGIGNRIFGCDICNEVCPWNKQFSRVNDDPEMAPALSRMAPPLLELLALDDAEFRERFKGSAVKRTKRRGLLRNVCVALGNWGDPEATPALLSALEDHEPLIRGHAAWALGRIAHERGEKSSLQERSGLERALAREDEEWVREEIGLALEASS